MISGYLSKAAEGHAEEELASPNTVSNIPQDESIHRGAPHNTLPSNRSLINAEPIDRSVPANMASQTLRADNVVSLDRGRILRDDSPPVSKIPPAHAVAGSEGREVGFPPDPATLPPSTAGQRLKRTGRRSQALRSEFQAQASGAGSSKKRKRDSATHSPSPDPNDASAYSHPAEEASSSPNRGGKSKEVLRPVARERGHDDELDDPPHPSTFTSPPHEALLNINKSDIRSIGVHSAVALFRRPSESSMKYARPPMSKLFASLELSPENFLHLQAAAKTYMLNDDYPERRECVGNRGKGDSDMVKLRLYNCANEFLEGEGNGERYFGRDVAQEGVARRRLIWPEQKQSILAAVTPLLRRMVTNERQRRYAVETRAKAGGPESKKRKADDAGLNESEPEMEVDQRSQRTRYASSSNRAASTH
ncbi:MAG: hypothetical protein M1838_004046 [Thelocarpon superellum]|nr:MAG: hypothetical protein M1838_004046 [Thelocarpon superellum]